MYAHALLSPKWGSRGLTNLTRLACFLLLQWATYETVARLRAYLADKFKMGARPQLCCHVFISHFLLLPSFSCASWDWRRYCNYRLRPINLERDWKNVPSFFLNIRRRVWNCQENPKLVHSGIASAFTHFLIPYRPPYPYLTQFSFHLEIPILMEPNYRWNFPNFLMVVPNI